MNGFANAASGGNLASACSAHGRNREMLEMVPDTQELQLRYLEKAERLDLTNKALLPLDSSAKLSNLTR